MIWTADCRFDPKTKRLTLELPSFPSTLEIKSTRTGRVMRFVQVGPGHPEYDEDGWDGEGQAYEPTEPCNVKTLMVWRS